MKHKAIEELGTCYVKYHFNKPLHYSIDLFRRIMPSSEVTFNFNYTQETATLGQPEWALHNYFLICFLNNDVFRLVIVRVVLSVFISVVRGMPDVVKESSCHKGKFSVKVISTIN